MILLTHLRRKKSLVLCLQANLYRDITDRLLSLRSIFHLNRFSLRYSYQFYRLSSLRAEPACLTHDSYMRAVFQDTDGENHQEEHQFLISTRSPKFFSNPISATSMMPEYIRTTFGELFQKSHETTKNGFHEHRDLGSLIQEQLEMVDALICRVNALRDNWFTYMEEDDSSHVSRAEGEEVEDWCLAGLKFLQRDADTILAALTELVERATGLEKDEKERQRLAGNLGGIRGFFHRVSSAFSRSSSSGSDENLLDSAHESPELSSGSQITT